MGQQMTNDVQQEYESWRAEQYRELVNQLRVKARRTYGQSSLLLDIGDASVREKAKQLLAMAASAFWQAEGGELEDIAHTEMDEYGTWVRGNLGCSLAFERGEYRQTCPVAIAHKRVGLSMGYTARKRICAICSKDFADCEHFASRLYDVAGGAGAEGFCRVCGIADCVEHVEGEIYRTAPVYIVTEIARIHEVSLVRRPAQPHARLKSVPVDMEAIKRASGAGFKPGMPVSCNRCLRECDGIEEVVED